MTDENRRLASQITLDESQGPIPQVIVGENQLENSQLIPNQNRKEPKIIANLNWRDRQVLRNVRAANRRGRRMLQRANRIGVSILRDVNRIGRPILRDANRRGRRMLQRNNRIGLPILRNVNRRSRQIFRSRTILPKYRLTKFQNTLTRIKHSVPLILNGEENVDQQFRLINERFQQYESHKAALQVILDDRSNRLAQMVLDHCYSSNSKSPEPQFIPTGDTSVANELKPFSSNDITEEPTTSSENHSKIRRSYAKQFKQEGVPTDLITIGPNGTRVSEKLISSIDWSVVNSATRKLLMIVFDRDTLASHSLTGRPSPAFIEKNDYVVKSKLDENKINDIIHMVTTKSKASEKHVRQAITIKLADEQKMKRQREERALTVDQRRNNISKK